jgi:hypothetical protein
MRRHPQRENELPLRRHRFQPDPRERSDDTLATEELFSQMTRLRQLSMEWTHLAAPYLRRRPRSDSARHTNA